MASICSRSRSPIRTPFRSKRTDPGGRFDQFARLESPNSNTAAARRSPLSVPMKAWAASTAGDPSTDSAGAVAALAVEASG